MELVLELGFDFDQDVWKSFAEGIEALLEDKD